MNIALLHFRVGATDGVSLEMKKWKTVLEDMGHRVLYIAAEKNQAEALLIPEMSILSDQHQRLFKNCYEKLTDYSSAEALEQEIFQQASVIEQKLLDLISKHHIDMIVPNNVSSLGLNLPTGLAIAHVIEKTQIKVIYHHHDFYWERERYNHPTAPFITDMLASYFPYHDQNRTKHCVINALAQNELLKRRNITSTVIPNVFDFSEAEWKIDTFNQDLREKLGIQPNDIVFLQATRIEDRKAIELALDVILSVYQKKDQFIGKTLYSNHLFDQHSKIHLIIAGLNEIRADKFKILKHKMDQMPYPTHIIHDMIGSKRLDQNEKIYALWDVYAISDYVTYPSILEGWGNQFLEALFAKKPILIYEYPVYLSDIQQFGFDTISLGNQYTYDQQGLVTVPREKIEHAADAIIDVLFNSKKYEKITNLNFRTASTHFSYDSLSKKLKSIL